MNHGLLFALILLAALGAGLIGGVFFAFSAFVMKALARLPPAQGITAMQSINLVVINRAFLGVFFGTAAVCAVLALTLPFLWTRPGACWLLAGSLFYLVGTVAVTILFNVPRNNVLAAVDSRNADGARLWTGYLTSWTAWNHVRTAASLGASASFILALR